MASTNDSIGPYQIIRKITSSSMSHVYLAHHMATPDRLVIIKFFHSAYLTSAQDYGRFSQEAQTLAAFKHPSILPILDNGIDSGFPYLVLEYASNGSLRDRLKRQAPYPLPAKESFAILVQVGQALQAAHQQGILHGDLKPENVLFNARGEALLADFIIPSILATAGISFSELPGSLPYMAPEERQGQLSKESDQYALGCLAYELVTGQQPFTTSAYPIPPIQQNPQLPAYVSQAILQAIAQQPSSRHANVAAFLTALGMSSIVQPSTPTPPPLSMPTPFPMVSPPQPTNAPLFLSAEAGTPLPSVSNPSNPGWGTPLPLPFSNTGTTSPNTFPNTAWASPVPLPYPSTGNPPPNRPNPLPKQPSVWQQRLKSRRFITLALIALILLIILGSSPFTVPYLLSILPASSATVTITPVSKTLNQTYTLSAVTGTPNASQNQVGARLLSYTSPVQTRTVKATGRMHISAVQAKGILTFFNPSATITITVSSNVPSNSGVTITTDGAATIVPGGSADIPAHAQQAGPGGNIPAFDINAQYSYVNNPGISFSVQNSQPFIGGANAQDITFVQQSDIDGAVTPIEASLTPDAQAKTMAQLKANEQLAAPVQCVPKVSANNPANSHANSATVKVSVKCTGEAFDKQGALSMAGDLLMRDAGSNPGAGYVLVGDEVKQVMQFQITDSAKGIVSLQVSATGVWAFQFGPTQQQSLAQSITGKTQRDADAALLKQAGVLKVSISTSGFGNALPSSADAIKFVVTSIPGLHAPATS